MQMFFDVLQHTLFSVRKTPVYALEERVRGFTDTTKGACLIVENVVICDTFIGCVRPCVCNVGKEGYVQSINARKAAQYTGRFEPLDWDGRTKGSRFIL